MLSWDEHMFINPDLTLYIEREPAGEWVALQSRMRVSQGSVGHRRERPLGRARPDRPRDPGADRRATRRELLEPEGLDAHVVLLGVARVDPVGQGLDDRQQRGV